MPSPGFSMAARYPTFRAWSFQYFSFTARRRTLPTAVSGRLSTKITGWLAFLSPPGPETRKGDRHAKSNGRLGSHRRELPVGHPLSGDEEDDRR